MSYLRKMILDQGEVFPGNVLKVDSFLNHQIDPTVIAEVAKEFYAYFQEKNVTKILTIESSGIAPALILAHYFKVPMLFAKKTKPSTLKNQDNYETSVHSFTKNTTSTVMVSGKYLNEDDNVLIIDDFLANGNAALGLVDLVKQAGAEISGVGICIEKSFQPGRERLLEHGIDLFSICRIESLDNGEVTFHKHSL